MTPSPNACGLARRSGRIRPSGWRIGLTISAATMQSWTHVIDTTSLTPAATLEIIVQHVEKELPLHFSRNLTQAAQKAQGRKRYSLARFASFSVLRPLRLLRLSGLDGRKPF
ncbi:MAG: hypothetical protein R2911_17400 [Caldilineaceae bacterium]